MRGEIVLLLPVAGFPGAPLLALVERFHEHAIPYSAAAQKLGHCEGSDGASISATRRVRDVRPSEIGGLVVLDNPDGDLRDHRPALELVCRADCQPILVAGVGDGALVLFRAGILRGGVLAADRRSADRLRGFGAGVLLEPLLIDNHVATATESGAAALGDVIHDLRGPTAMVPEPPA